LHCVAPTQLLDNLNRIDDFLALLGTYASEVSTPFFTFVQTGFNRVIASIHDWNCSDDFDTGVINVTVQ
jgi:hypothetical protein